MSRIAEAFDSGEAPLFIAFTVAGDPDDEVSLGIARTMIGAGAGILELGVPFSDPVADGPAIEMADQRALKGGGNPSRVFALVRKIREGSAVPIVLLTYCNIVLRMGADRFYQEAASSGVDGVLVVDMPVEESGDVLKAAKRFGVDRIFTVTPTTSSRRLERILSEASGFLYIVSVTGITGVRDDIPPKLPDLVRRVKARSKIPVAVGFGISRPEHVRALHAAGADGVIVGSALVGLIEKHLDDKDAMKRAIDGYIRKMRDHRTEA
jgi:tryptophan synthase alpha chain